MSNWALFYQENDVVANTSADEILDFKRSRSLRIEEPYFDRVINTAISDTPPYIPPGISNKFGTPVWMKCPDYVSSFWVLKHGIYCSEEQNVKLSTDARFLCDDGIRRPLPPDIRKVRCAIAADITGSAASYTEFDIDINNTNVRALTIIAMGKADLAGSKKTPLEGWHVTAAAGTTSITKEQVLEAQALVNWKATTWKIRAAARGWEGNSKRFKLGNNDDLLPVADYNKFLVAMDITEDHHIRPPAVTGSDLALGTFELLLDSF